MDCISPDSDVAFMNNDDIIDDGIDDITPSVKKSGFGLKEILTAICNVYTFLFLIQILPAFAYTQLFLDFIRRSVNIALAIWMYFVFKF